MATFLCTIEYGEKGHEILLEVWLTNDKPKGATGRDEVELALRDTAASGVPPEGWEVAVINWSHPRSNKEGGGAADLQQFDSLIRSGEVKIKMDAKPPRRESEEEE